LACAEVDGVASGNPVTAVIVTHQSARTLRRALDGAHRCNAAQLLDLVIVDNASTDATRKIIEREAKWARCILSDRNNGFGNGCNIGFREVTSPYTLFLNPDALIEPDAVRGLLQFMQERPQAGIVGPAIVEGEEKIELQDTGVRPTPWTILRDAMPFVPRRASSWPIVPGSEPRRTGWVCGAVFMIRTELMKRLTGFDPRFFLYWEEMDLCLRAEREEFEIWAVGAATALHVGGASTPQNDTRIGGCIAKHYYQSRYYYMVKHHGKVLAAIADIGEFAFLALRSLADALRGRGLHRLQPRLQARLMSKPCRI
jgi:hypothetical protein